MITRVDKKLNQSDAWSHLQIWSNIDHITWFIPYLWSRHTIQGHIKGEEFAPQSNIKMPFNAVAYS